MPKPLVVFPSPLEATVTCTPDSTGQAIVGAPYIHPTGRPGQVCAIPDTVPTNEGAALDITAPGWVSAHLRGLLVLSADGLARLQVDDVHLTLAPAAPVPIPPAPGGMTPFEIITRVYDETDPDLSTVEGCGRFTEDCCTQLHMDHSNLWGHVKKNPGQNQYNGHAVDAVMLLGAAPDCAPGIYDIIYSSASSEARPVFNFADPPDYELWYYPAETYRIGVTKDGEPVLRHD